MGSGVVVVLLLVEVVLLVVEEVVVVGRATVRLSVRQFRTAMNRQKGARLKGTDSIEEI